MERSVRSAGYTKRWRNLLSFCLVLMCLSIATTASAQNTTPTITGISNQSIDEDENTGALAFTVGDAETSANSLSLTRSSSNTTLVPVGNISLSSGGANRTVTVTPVADAFGSTDITLTVSDGTNSANSVFTVTVRAVNDRPTISGISNVTIDEDTSTSAISFTIADVDNDVSTFTPTATSSDTTLIPGSNIVFGGSGGSRTVTVTPAADENGNSDISITISDGSLSASEDFRVNVTAVNDPPVLSGSVNGAIDDDVSVNLLSGLSVSDPDQKPGKNESITVTVTIPGGENAAGSFEGRSPRFDVTGTPSEVTVELATLVFVPIPNRVPVGQTESFNLELTLADGSAPAQTSTYPIAITSVNDAPTGSQVFVSPSTFYDTQTVQPFQLEISDPDLNETFTVSIVPLTDTNSFFGALVPAAPRMTNSLETVESYVRSISYAPVYNGTAGSQPLQFEVRLTDAAGAVFVQDVTLTLQGNNDPPDIVGTEPDVIRIRDDETVVPFSRVRIEDVDQQGQQPQNITLSLTDLSKGSFTPSGPFTNITAAAATALLRSVVFTPTPDRIPLGQTETVNLIITVVDSGGLHRIDDRTSVAITSVNSAPRIVGVAGITNQPVLIQPNPPVLPFTGISVFDDDGTNVTVTVQLDDPSKGMLVSTNGFVETTEGSGLYRMVGMPIAIADAFAALEYQLNPTYLFPSSAPGGTTFVIEATDVSLNRSSKSLFILVQSDPGNFLVTRDEDDEDPGSLRHAVANVSNNGVITFALPEYPALIRLNAPLKLNKNVAIKGPGADKLRISGDSNGDGIPEQQLFQVRAVATMEGFTLTKGTAWTGGAIHVGTNATLVVRYCAITDSVASQWGGAIDVQRGALIMENCLVSGNRTDPSLGLGGGAISIWSDQRTSFSNTTFSGNRQESPTGFGGGAIYIENFTPSTIQSNVVVNCTFALNADLAGQGSSIFANVFGAQVETAGSIYADHQGRNLEVKGAAQLFSLGGNLSDDTTATTLTQGGVPQSVILLNQDSDKRSVTNTILGALSLGRGPTAVHPLVSGSPAIGIAEALAPAIDQQGVIRDASPDAGAAEFAALERVVINEIQAKGNTNELFVELFVLRDSSPVNLAGYEIWQDGIIRHIFGFGTVIQPGFGIVVANSAISTGSTNNPTPVVVASPNLFTADQSGLIELRKPSADGRAVSQVFFLDRFIDPFDPSSTNKYTGNSITLATQFYGHAFVPHSAALPPPLGGVDVARDATANLESPGSDTSPTPFGLPNAFPVSVADTFVVDEDLRVGLNVLWNDIDADGLDRLVLLGASDLSTNLSLPFSPGVSQAGGLLEIGTNAEAVWYDPRFSQEIQQLAEGIELSDTFYYSMVDFGTGTITGYASTNADAAVLVSSPAHRLLDGVQIRVTGADIESYSTNHAVTYIDDDTFSIVTPYLGTGTNFGSWATVGPRTPTETSIAEVTLSILGANDPPAPFPDFVSTTEDQPLRILGDATLVNSGTSFNSDSNFTPAPDVAPTNLLVNDIDVDTDDSSTSLNVVGVLSNVNTIQGFSAGSSGVLVASPEHGLETGTVVLIANYGGHSSYNGYHVVAVVDEDNFTIPVTFVDAHPVAGVWALLNDNNRLAAKSELDADVVLEIRNERQLTGVVYNPQTSSILNALANDETSTDSFYYAVSDRHGALGITRVEVLINGVNDTPVTVVDPNIIASIPASDNVELGNLIGDSSISYARIPDASVADRAEASIVITEQTYVVTQLPTTDEDSILILNASEFLANDSDVDDSDELELESVADLSHENARVSLSANRRVITYDPTASVRLNQLARNEPLMDSFTVMITDTNGGTVESLIAVLVTGRDDTPIAQPDTFSTVEGVVTNFSGLLANDVEYDIDGNTPDNRLDLQRISSTPTQLDGVRHELVGTSLTYNPTNSAFVEGLSATETAIDSIDYVVTDGSFVFANADDFKVRADGSGYTLNVLSNDRNLTGNDTPLTITSVGVPNHDGSVSIQSQGTSLRYSPTVSFVGDEFFTYTVSDGYGNSSVALVSVRVLVDQLNGNLQANDDYFSVALGESVLLPVLANDEVLPVDAGSVQLAQITVQPEQGSAAPENGLIRFTPGNSVGAFHLKYQITGGGTSIATANVTVRVVDRANTLVVRDDAYSVPAGSQDNSLNVLVNDSLLPGSGSGLFLGSILTDVMHGTVTTNLGNNALVYTPEANFVGNDFLVYEALDGFGGTGSATVRISVGSLSTESDYFTVQFEGGLKALDVLANDRVLQSPGDNIRILDVNPKSPTLGLMAVQSGGQKLEFTPGAGQLGEQVFQYVITNDFGGSAAGELTVSVRQEGVKANPDFFTVLTDSQNNALNVTLNDASIPDRGRTNFVYAIGTGLNAPNRGGSVQINSSNTGLIYSPAPGFSGEESFSYSITDSRGTDTAKVVVKVSAGELSANDDVYTVFLDLNSSNQPRSFELPVIANDRVLPDFGQQLQITDVFVDSGAGTNAPATRGNVEVRSDGAALIYTPGDLNAPYEELVTYEISDGTARRNMAMVSITVEQRVDAQESETNDDSFSVAANSEANILPVLLNDNVLPANATNWVITETTTSAHGGAVSVSGLNLIYTPIPGFVGTETFTYFVSDKLGGTGSGEVTVTVGDLPLSADEFTALSGTRDNVFDVLANDAVRPDLAAAFELLDIIQPPDRGGIASIVAGKVHYSPAVSVVGTYPYTEKFAYRVRDNSGGTVTGNAKVHVHRLGADRSKGTVTITVMGLNDAPTISGTVTNQTVYEHSVIRPFAGVRIGDVDSQGTQSLNVTIQLSNPANGTLSALGSFVDAGAGLYRLASGAPSVATSSIRQMVFTPADSSRVQPGVPEQTQFTITVSDNVAPDVVDTNTSVIAVDAVLGRLDMAGVVSGTGFGSAVASSRDYVVVGVPGASHNGRASGVAYVYGHVPGDFDTWIVLQKLVPDSPASISEFGASVAIDGRTIVVGAPSSLNGTFANGVAQVFQQNETTGEWAFEKTLMSMGGGFGNRFGESVAVQGGTIAIGAPFDDVDLPADAGSVHVFERGSDLDALWSQTTKLSRADSAAGDHFGNSLDFGDDLLAVGSPAADIVGTDSGSVHVFGRNVGGSDQWGFAQRLLPDDGAAGDEFGNSVQIDSERVAVGAWLSDAAGRDSGAVYTFSLAGGIWEQDSRVVSSTGAAGDQFGRALGLDGSYLLVGAPGSDLSGLDAGMADVYLWSTNWTAIDRFTTAPGSFYAGFGGSVSLNLGTVVIGSHFDNAIGSSEGQAHIYQLRYNNAPVASEIVPDLVAVTGQAFNFTVPDATFSDPDVDGDLVLSVDPADLPAGLVFDSLTRSISGIPTVAGSFIVNIVASDRIGETASNSVTIKVWASDGTTLGVDAPGVVPTLVMNLDVNSGLFVLSFSRKPGASYSLQSSFDLINWNTADTLIYREEVMAVDDTSELVRLYLQGFGGSSGLGFYQIVVSP